MNHEYMGTLVRFVLAALAIVLVLRQCRKPAWLPGRLFLRVMNRSHVALTTIVLAGKVYGIDYSQTSVAAARKTNARSIEQGRVDIRLGSVSKLPFDANTLDVVTAFETHYYWPDLAADVKETLRVLKQGGRLVIVAETYRGRPMDWLYQPAMRLLRATYLSLAEHRQLLEAAGYTAVDVAEERFRGWVCVIGQKPV